MGPGRQGLCDFSVYVTLEDILLVKKRDATGGWKHVRKPRWFGDRVLVVVSLGAGAGRWQVMGSQVETRRGVVGIAGCTILLTAQRWEEA